ncbi:MAG: E3 binding domain-containing protein [Actinomycetota bacterium]|nr:E3 binding domain-containing protein [Actinomycetota bacterium]
MRAIFSEVLGSLEHNPRFFREDSGTTDRTAGSAQGALNPAEEPTERDDGGGAATEEADSPEATDAARQKARELGLDLSSLEGTGSGGRIILRDVQRAARG